MSSDSSMVEAPSGFYSKLRAGRIVSLALPIIAGMVSQNLLNLVDTAFVSVLGDEALAAVGYGSFANFLSIAFITGLAVGVQASAARRKGEGRHDETAVALNGGLLLAVAFALPIGAVVYFFAPVAFPMLTTDTAVATLGISYLQIRLLAVPAVGMNFAFRGYWNAVDQSRMYLKTIVVMHVVNATLDYLLIFGSFGAPKLGVAGAAWASFAATWVGTVYYVLQAFRHARSAGFFANMPSVKTLGTLLRTSVPGGLQQFGQAASITTFFVIVGRLGTAEAAASNVLVNVLMVALLPAIGFGLAAASLVGQALGQNDIAMARRWGWDVLRVAVPVIGGIACIGLVFPDIILSIFLHDPETRAMARWPLRLMALALPIDVIGLVLLNALMGAGDTKRVLLLTLTLQWLVFLPAAYVVGIKFGLGLTAVWMANAGYRLLLAAVFVAVWRSTLWTRAKV